MKRFARRRVLLFMDGPRRPDPPVPVRRARSCPPDRDRRPARARTRGTRSSGTLRLFATLAAAWLLLCPAGAQDAEPRREPPPAPPAAATPQPPTAEAPATEAPATGLPPRQKQAFTVRAASSAIRIDGQLDEDAWKSAAAIPVAKEWFPGDNTPPVVATECLVTYDHDNLYVAFRAQDPDPGAIRAHLGDRDTSFLDDTVGVLLDPFHDERRAFQFRSNPLGVQMDATLSDVEGIEDWSWDAIWESSGTITEQGYTVEIRIPFSSLRFPRTTGVQTWGFLAMRDYPRSTRRRMRSMHSDRNRDCIVCQFDTISGFEGITPGINVELDPTLSAVRTDVRDFPDSGILARHEDTSAGLTARWGVTPNIILGAALNPDFNGVEADAAQLAENERFALFFPEKRPLFLEGADFFATPIQAVFTRTIADPVGAVKITGKEGRAAFGVFLARDRENVLIFPSNQFSFFSRFTDSDVSSGVVRYRYDLPHASNVGVLYSGRQGDGYSQRVYGLDGNLRFTDSDSVAFQYLHSGTDYPVEIAAPNGQPEGPFHGEGYLLRYVHRTRNWAAFATYEDLEPGFRADSGFIDRADIKLATASLTRTLWGGPSSWFNQIQLTVAADRTDDHGDLPADNSQDLEVVYSGPLQSTVDVNLAWNRENFDGTAYDNFRSSVFGQIRPSGSLACSLFAQWGETIDFANSRQADFLTLSPAIELSIGRHIGGRLDHTTQRLDVAGGRLFTARLTQTRVLYHVSRRIFVRAILQYLDVDRNAALYAFPVSSKTETFFTQLLFSYKLNPQTVCQIGYSDNSLGLDGIDLTQTDRTFFIKLGYAWVL